MVPLARRPRRSDYIPDGDGEYAESVARWQADFEDWAKATRDEEWHWGATMRQIADSYDEWRTFMHEPLPKVAKWARAQARTAD